MKEQNLKEQILTLLGRQKASGDDECYVSGQKLCDELNVSRTAVWKVINQLKEEGYEIGSVTGKGYRMTGRPDRVTAEEIISRLDTKWAARKVCYLETTDSTNDEAKRLADQGAGAGTLVVAEEQSQGKGRRGRSWLTPSGSAIAMSLILRPQIPPQRASMLTLIMGMAAAAACRDCCGADVSIKWPNDVVSGGRKICGILTEMSSEVDYINYIVIGVGINTGIENFPPELEDTAVSLHTLMGAHPDRSLLIDVCMEKFEQYYDRFMQTEDFTLLLDEYNAELAGIGDRVRVLSPGNEFEGISEGINSLGELIVRKSDGDLENIFAGEVSVRGVYGYV